MSIPNEDYLNTGLDRVILFIDPPNLPNGLLHSNPRSRQPYQGA